MNMKYDAVVFDMDGVIFDSEKMVIICWKEVAQKYGIENIEYACKQCLGTNKDASRARFKEIYGQDFPYDTYKAEMSALFHERCSGGKLPLKPGVNELLEYLKSQKKKIALASSTRREVVLRELEDGGVLSYFDKVICGDMVERSKPFPDIYLKACEEIGVEPEMAVAIEDSYNGIRSANRAGLQSIMVPDLIEANDEMRDLSKIVLNSLIEVKDYLKG